MGQSRMIGTQKKFLTGVFSALFLIHPFSFAQSVPLQDKTISFSPETAVPIENADALSTQRKGIKKSSLSSSFSTLSLPAEIPLSAPSLVPSQLSIQKTFVRYADQPFYPKPKGDIKISPLIVQPKKAVTDAATSFKKQIQDSRDQELRKRRRLIYRQEIFTGPETRSIKNRQGKIAGYRMADGTKILYREVSASWIEIRNAQGMIEHSISDSTDAADQKVTLDLGKGLKAVYHEQTLMELRHDSGTRWMIEHGRVSGSPVHQIITPNGDRYFLYRGYVLRHISAQQQITDFTPEGSIVRRFFLPETRPH